jgi:uncharacterized protein YdhG (YjbR/CyaY superfamily)
MKASKPQSVEAYIAACDDTARPTLNALRDLIRSTVPETVEKIWYGVPFYDHHGELAGFAAYKKHVSFGFGADALTARDRQALEEKGYKLGKGTLQIRFNQDLPAAQIQSILKAKAKLNEARTAAK